MPQIPRVLIGAAGVLFAVGLVLAIVQPGNLGGDSVETAESTTTTSSSSTPTLPTSSTTPEVTSTTTAAAPDPGSGSGAPSGGTGQTGGGSGLGQGGTPQVDDLDDGLPNTGHESLFLLGALCGAAGLTAGRLSSDRRSATS